MKNMKVVKNNVVSMDWNAEGFIDHKREGFIAAVHQYGNTGVAFKDGVIYTFVDDEGAYGFQDLVSDIKKAVKEKDGDYPTYYQEYVEIHDGENFTDNLEALGLEEYADDMIARLKDLSDYWVFEETPMM